MKHRFQVHMAALAFLLLLSSCGGKQETPPFVDETPIGNPTANEQEAITDQPAIPDLLTPEASGLSVSEGEEAIIDYSNIGDG